ncbi:glycosyl group 2, partial [Nannochloropsis gaditana]
MFHFARRAAIIACVWGSIFCLQESNAIKRDTNTSVCLAMIIKNEGPILPRLFDSVRGFVSEYCVMDTGSTDDTVDVLKSIDVPGQVLHGPFINFAQARNLMIDECRKLMKSCDYFLLLDADMILKVHP